MSLIIISGCSENTEQSKTDNYQKEKELNAVKEKAKPTDDSEFHSKQTEFPTVIVKDSGEIDLSEGVYIVKIQKPVVEIKNNTASADIINKAVDDTINQQLETLHQYNEQNAEKLGIKYGMDTGYDVYRMADGIVSIKLNISLYTGAAHPLNDIFAVNYFTDTGKKIALKDLFVNDYDYKSVINTVIANTISKYESEGKIGYYESYKRALDGNEKVFIDDKGIVIAYGAGEIAPYAVGAQKFVVPYSLLLEGLNPTYFSSLK